MPASVVTEHLHTCSSCRNFVEDAHALRQAIRHHVPNAPDLTTRILAAAREQRHPRLREVTMLRLGLVAVAIAQLALAVPSLIYGTDEGAPIHIAHEVGAWDLALAIGFLFAAWRPLRAVGLLPFVAALSAGLLLTAVIDVVHGRAVALTETTHLLELFGTLLLWMLASPRRPVVRPELRVV